MTTERLENVKGHYLARKGYSPASGQYVFARKDAIRKAVAFFDGIYGREAHKAVMAEVTSLGLETVTVLVNGQVTYSGAGINAIRIDADYEASFMAQDVDSDFMTDTRLAKKLHRSASRLGM